MSERLESGDEKESEERERIQVSYILYIEN